MKNVISPLVSIVLCTYNGAKYLPAQLDSILAQTHANIELVVVDDNSIDDTIKILENYNEKYVNHNIKIHQNIENLGYIKNFEKGINLAKGDYIAISDQDDIWKPEKIAKCVENIGNNSLIYHDSEFIDEEGNLLNKKISEIIKMYQGNDCRALLLDNCVSGHSMMFKKEILQFIFPFSTKMHYDWWIAFVASAYQGIAYIDEALVQYRQHTNNVTDMLGRSNEQKEEQITPYMHAQAKIAHKRLEFENEINRLEQLTKAPFKDEKIKKYVLNFYKAMKHKEKYVFVPSLLWIWLKGLNIVFETRYKKKKSNINHIIQTALFRCYNAIPTIENWREKYKVKF